MKLPAGLVGTTAGPRAQDVDARWLMAYSAALGEADPLYFDTLRPGGILPHPLFPVCYEWPLALDLRGRLSEEVALRSVHLTHDLRIHRPPRAGDRLRTTATVVAVAPHRAGAQVVTRFETVDASGGPVTTTDYGSLYLGVECVAAGEKTPPSTAPVAGGEPAWTTSIAVSPTLAHVYTECARIWNPIHTDRAVAKQAGLPDIILHGTATLALAVSGVLAREGPAAVARVDRVVGRFGTMVRMPSTLTLQGFPAAGEQRWLPFQAVAADGRPAVREGAIGLMTKGRQ
jgi:acyl dehydratase